MNNKQTISESVEQITDTPNKRTLVLGATNNPARYAYLAVNALLNKGIEPIPLGIRQGTVKGIEILHGEPALENVHTVTLYLNPERQKAYYDYILGLKPKRIIFNPGTENPELMRLARENGIEVEVGCTLVMLSVGTF